MSLLSSTGIISLWNLLKGSIYFNAGIVTYVDTRLRFPEINDILIERETLKGQQ